MQQLPQAQPSSSPVASVTTPSPLSSSPTTSPSPKNTTQDIQQNIQDAINSKNYQGLVGYMQKPKVNFIIMSSSCCEPKTPDEAAAQLDYVKDGPPFDFNQNTTLVKNLKAKNTRLTNAYIGLSKTNENLVAFTLDSNSLITQIEVSVSFKLYNQ
jgi:hypothetical protein